MPSTLLLFPSLPSPSPSPNLLSFLPQLLKALQPRSSGRGDGPPQRFKISAGAYVLLCALRLLVKAREALEGYGVQAMLDALNGHGTEPGTATANISGKGGERHRRRPMTVGV